MPSEQPVILVVEDERDLADLYSEWLSDDYEVRIANSGPDALDRLDGVDVVLLDRRMPEQSGEEALAEMRERGFSGRVAMVTAVDPDFDIVGMGFDDYVVKPVSDDDLRDVIERLLRRNAYTDEIREFFSTVSKKAVLEVEKDTVELVESDRYAELEERYLQDREQLDAMLEGMDHEDFETLFRDLREAQAGDFDDLGGEF